MIIKNIIDFTTISIPKRQNKDEGRPRRQIKITKYDYRELYLYLFLFKSSYHYYYSYSLQFFSENISRYEIINVTSYHVFCL